jgi:hypothetical protein
VAPVTVSERAREGGLASQRVLAALARVPAGPAPRRAERRPLLPLTIPWPPTDFRLREVRDYWQIASPAVKDRTLIMTAATVEPRYDITVLDTAGVENVLLVVVGVPAEFTATKPAKAKYLLYWRPRPNDDDDRYGPSYTAPEIGPYPYNFDFAYYGIWNYLNYRADPLTYREERWMPSRTDVARLGDPGLKEVAEKFSFGLPYQLRAAAKPLILVQPVFGMGSYPGGLATAVTAQAFIEAVHAWVWRLLSPGDRPALDAVAIAGYSNGAEVAATFVASNVRSPFVQDVLREALLFDPPAETATAFTTHGPTLNTWATAKPGRRIALYSQVPFSTLPRTVPQPPNAGLPSLGETPGWRFLFTPTKSWTEAQRVARRADAARLFAAMNGLRAVGWDSSPAASAKRAAARRTMKESAADDYARLNEMDFDAVHFAIPAMMLTDALRTSSL